jgi:predicted dinucleotide-binding enzyme
VKPNIRIARGQPTTVDIHVIHLPRGIKTPLSVDLKGRVSSEVFAELVPGARVVKAFNHLRAEIMAGDPKEKGGRRVLF